MSGRSKGALMRSKPKRGTPMAEQKPTCVFCKTTTRNKYLLGKMLSRDDVCAHYYCILFAPALRQNGSLADGIKGFLVDDIKKEVRRGCRLACSFCGLKGAVIGCAVGECHIKFHLPCGIQHNAFLSFHHPSKTFPAYCPQHRPYQRMGRDQIRQLGAKPAVDVVCLICQESITPRPTVSTLFTPCCVHWFHRECLQKQSYHAGEHHFKCPNCNNRDQFVAEMKRLGIHVPERDASWERRNEFAYLYQREFSCTVEKCVARQGRAFNGDKKWEIIACDGCGANGTHARCSRLPETIDTWYCEVCKSVLDRGKTPLAESTNQ